MINIAIAGVGNCASSLVQGIDWYAAHPGDTTGLTHPDIGGHRVEDIRIVCAFDIDARKVGRPLHEAIFAPPNNALVFHPDVNPKSKIQNPKSPDPLVLMAPPLDGVPDHMNEYPPEQRFEPAGEPPVDVARALRESGAEILVNYLPVGAQQATEHYARACLEAGVSLVNCIPVFIVSDSVWAQRFTERGIPCVGDDVKSQLGATITHRTLTRLFADRGVRIDSTYQLNTGGNTDFLNMLNRQRLASKKRSKTDAVQSQLDPPLDPGRIHIGPSDYVPFLKDNKVCYIRIEATGFAGAPLDLELRLSVQDSPNSAGAVVDAIRCCAHARKTGLSGPLEAPSAWTMKHPPRQMTDNHALAALHEFLYTP